jgi:hypothetical protein
MRYLRSYFFLFTQPRWGANLLLISLCLLIPAVGLIVLLGYAFDLLECLHKRGDTGYPGFDFNRFSAYLARGLVPLVVYLPVLFLVVIFAFFCTIVLRDSPVPSRSVGRLMTLMIMFFGVSLLFGLVLVPLSLRAGLTQKLDGPASMEFVRDFLNRVWKEVLLVWLFVLVTAQVLMLAGLLLCAIGLYPALAVGVCAQHHLMYQLYELYLRRGGRALPLARGPSKG